MKKSYQIPALTAAVTVLTALLLVPSPGSGQTRQLSDAERAEVEAAQRARAIARAIRNNARQLTIFDREGNVVSTIGERDMYIQPVFSPDQTRLAVIKSDFEAETQELWVLDLATGAGTQITSSQPRERVVTPAWSPDGSQLAYVALRGSYFGIYRQASNGDGEEELLSQYPGGTIFLTDWSLDGRFLSLSSNDLSGGRLYRLPLDGDGQLIEIVRSESALLGARPSPDGRFLAYRSDETGRNEIFVRSLAPSADAEQAPVDTWQVSTEGGVGMFYWRQDGRELYFLGADRRMMAVTVDTNSGFAFEPPRALFKVPDAFPVRGAPGGFGNISRDGERVVLAIPPDTRLRQITVFDRTGSVVSRVGEPGVYNQPALSPDGSTVVVMGEDRQTGTRGLWAFDVATGERTQVAVEGDDAGTAPFAPIWSPDGHHVAYVYMRDNYAGLYRKAWNGTGSEELLYRYTLGAGMVLTDFSADGRFAAVDGGGILLVVPLTGTDPLAREAVEFGREEFEVGLGRFSPDSRFMAYGSNETGRFEVYVRPFDASSGEAAGDEKWQVSEEGAMGGIFWRQDGTELYYLSEDTDTDEVKVMAVEVTTTPSFEAGPARLLFRLPGPLPGNPTQWKNISPDGERFVFIVEAPAVR